MGFETVHLLSVHFQFKILPISPTSLLLYHDSPSPSSSLCHLLFISITTFSSVPSPPLFLDLHFLSTASPSSSSPHAAPPTSLIHLFASFISLCLSFTTEGLLCFVFYTFCFLFVFLEDTSISFLLFPQF